MHATKLLQLFFATKDCRKGMEWTVRRNSEYQFYSVKNVTQLKADKADFVGKGINASLENQVCKAFVFDAYFAFIP